MPPEPRISDEIISHAVPTDEDLFAQLSASALLEDVGKGRRGATLTKPDAAGHVPLVRTTTRYGSPTQRFRPIHDRLAQRIQARAGLSNAFNNALLEVYTNAYATMGSHSDQALDLAADSFIAVFSCYQHPEAAPPRRLVFEPKGPGEKFEIPLAHNSFVAFSLATNRRLKHKIVLDTSAHATENHWLGVTFRTSKTLLQFHTGHPHLPQGTPSPRPTTINSASSTNSAAARTTSRTSATHH
ncbi:alpha-ketoglutarate-dependent dioxygenase AlkB [Nocardia crassostreae]|uniref:alpha-ketoglutarate-dependent dioxygenase AlkB n=1 Tax=Nocardia crassostreae TaxID=53428 RepID=UPI000AAF0589|nr:alpha-ketoglutarate-dependent dioxygenase AlkB [Nocardia crassostreae]